MPFPLSLLPLPGLARQILRWFLLPLLLPGVAHAAELKGIIRDPQGNPVPGASVFLPIAEAREGGGGFRLPRYPDYSKPATTDEAGRFTLGDLEDDLLFTILVAAPGYRATHRNRIDPRLSEISVTLPPADPERPALRGRVLDPEGRPISGAVIVPISHRKGGAQPPGGFPGDAIAITNPAGLFELGYSPDKADRIGLRVHAPQFARNEFETDVSATGPTPEFRLDRGATLRGRLMRGGVPVGGATIGLIQANRSVDHFLGPQESRTLGDGTFEFTHVPSGKLWELYAQRDRLPEGGVTGTLEIRTGEPETGVDAGDLMVEAGVPVEGTIELSDGTPLPSGTTVLILRRKGWDGQSRIADAHGRFGFTARSGEEVALFARVAGYGKGNPYEPEAVFRITPETRHVRLSLRKRDSPD